MSAARRIHEARLAMMMLTRIPMGHLPDPAPRLAQAAWAYPLVGLVTGGIGWAVLHAALFMGLTPLLGALVALAAMVLSTGALHEDGLADCADGLGGGRDRDHCLEIMRDSRIGSYGVVALVFALSLKTVALAEIATGPALLALLFTGVFSRVLMLAALVWMPAARRDGLGHGAAGPAAGALVPGAVSGAVLAVLLGPPALGALIAMGLGAAAVAALAQRRIKGQTGDVLGTVQAVSETLGLVALTAALA
ncbi:adenosylcobinamide-GDP ribazoletransferase [Aliishimia ponticola]|uniref:Adenosylcobinamide-GDP ribazoletransferase n=1 Tax=Aliishimia ponticola TaxID=2499833 RepID=A0A4S4NIX1_9RHOB|nr:adenosylcobinamide-GDP ribazoletransferase [Aliishimia ponticola]THH38178.1 adenosylcobinamide-GDP ribazoletransferase [Aliishimia ponticola]